MKTNQDKLRSIEDLAKKFHDIYNQELTRQNRESKWPDNYEALPEDIKDLDRALARYALALIKKDRQELIEEIIKKGKIVGDPRGRVFYILYDYLYSLKDK